MLGFDYDEGRWKIVCDLCSTTQTTGLDAKTPKAQVENVFKEKGWYINRRKGHICKTCMKSKRGRKPSDYTFVEKPEVKESKIKEEVSVKTIETFLKNYSFEDINSLQIRNETGEIFCTFMCKNRNLSLSWLKKIKDRFDENFTYPMEDIKVLPITEISIDEKKLSTTISEIWEVEILMGKQ